MFTVLLVEDNWADAFLTQQTFEELGDGYDLHVVEDAVSALAFLRGQPPFTQAPRPDVVLLDLNLPDMSGAELLVLARELPALERAVFVALLGSSGEADWWHRQGMRPDAFVTKPVATAQVLSVCGLALERRRAGTSS